MYLFLMVLTISSSIGLQSWRTLFDNFSVRVVGLTGGDIGIIQSVREIPGFLALLVVFVMLLFREHRIASMSIVTLGVGVALTGFFPSFLGLICTTLIMSIGFHYYETMMMSLTLQYFDEKHSPVVFGRLRSVSAASNIVVGAAIFVLVPYLSYQNLYLLFGGIIFIAGCWSFSRKPTRENLTQQRKGMVFKKKYSLYYFLTFMAGARRQIFVAFAVFLLVSKFDFSVQEITVLFVVNNIINYFLSPLIGKAIVRFGERSVLSMEYTSLLFIFIAYAFVESKVLVSLLYIADHIFFNFSIAIRTFFQKIGETEDIAPTMAVGFTINHIGAVVFPVVGGLLWMLDYRIPFFVGAGLALFSLIAVQFITRQIKNTTAQRLEAARLASESF